jgi:hypothetical protein
VARLDEAVGCDGLEGGAEVKQLPYWYFQGCSDLLYLVHYLQFMRL